MNKLLIACSIAALVYGEGVFAGTYEYDEESLNSSGDLSSPEDQQTDKAKMENQWKDFLKDQEEKEEKKEIKRYGTKDQWQDFFDLQEQSEKKPLTKRIAKDERLKKKAERAQKEERAFNALSYDLDKKLRIDDKSGKKLKGKSGPISKKNLIDLNQDDTDSINDQRHYKVNLNKQKYRENNVIMP